MDRTSLIYFGDPMCSWCYGFGPQLRAVETAFRDVLPLQVLVGGLRPYTTAPMGDELKIRLRHHWGEVAERTGQPFDYAVLDRADFVYDTEPACRAVVAARLLRAELALECFLALQDAFYRDGRDVTSRATLIDVAGAVGVDRSAFAQEFDSEIARQATRHNFLTAQNLGVRAFPTLLLQRDSRYWVVCRGYMEAAPLIAAIQQTLAR